MSPGNKTCPQVTPRRDHWNKDTESAFAKTPWTCETTKPLSRDERLTSASRASSEGALTRDNAAQTQCHLHLRHCLATPKQLFCLFSPLSHPHHRAATTGAPYNRPCAVSATQTTRVDGGPAGRPRGASTPPLPRLHALPRPLRKKEAPHPPRRFNAQSVLGRRAHADGGPSGGVPPSARNTRARSVSQESGASVGSRHACRGDSRRRDEEEV